MFHERNLMGTCEGLSRHNRGLWSTVMFKVSPTPALPGCMHYDGARQHSQSCAVRDANVDNTDNAVAPYYSRVAHLYATNFYNSLSSLGYCRGWSSCRMVPPAKDCWTTRANPRACRRRE